MRLTFLADLRSPIALQWIRHFVERGDDVQLISSYPTGPDPTLGAMPDCVPLVLAHTPRAASRRSIVSGSAHHGVQRIYHLVQPRHIAAVRSTVGPLMVTTRRRRLQALVDRHRPDLIHAMRIPFEGMAASLLTGAPIIVSVWGNDFTLFADRTAGMARATRRVLQRAAAVHCDCKRDARLARRWGFPEDRPTWVYPTNGGVDDSVFYPGTSGLRHRLGIAEDARIIVNPRGIREYVRTDTFFRSLPSVLARWRDVHVVCPGMAGSRYAETLMSDIGLGPERVHLLPALDRWEIADVFRAAEISVSLSTHDGTPNTLLEAMACGSFPILGDLESVREWVSRSNGITVPVEDPSAVSAAITRALDDETSRLAAREHNYRLVRSDANYRSIMANVESHYSTIIEGNLCH